MSIEDCKQGLTELLAGTKVSVETTKALQSRIENMMEVNAKYGGLDGNTNPQHILDDFVESLKIERIKQRNNTIRNAQVVNDMFVKITTNEKSPEYYGAALIDEISGGNHFRNSIFDNVEHVSEKTVGSFTNDLKRANLLDALRNADQTLSDDIIVEIRLAGGSKTDIPTKNKDAKTIAGIVYTHRENARILHNAYGGNIGKLEGYEGRTRYSATKLVNYGEKNYIKWAKDNYDWERIEKTKGRVISGIDRDEYISSVFELNTNSKNKLQESNEYLSNVGGKVGSSFNKSKSIFFKTGKWEEHNALFGETDISTNTFEQLLGISRATGAMRKAGANPTGNITKVMNMLQAQSGGKFSPKQVNEIKFQLKVITGEAFHVIDPKWKLAEDVFKNTTATSQLGNSAITNIFTDPVSSSMVYKRLGLSYTRGVQNAIRGSLTGFTKKQRMRINDYVDMTFQSDPHTIGNRFEASDNSGFGGKYMNRYFKLNLMSQVTDGAKINHTKVFMRVLADNRKVNWKNLDGDLKKTMKLYDIGQKDWDIIRKHGLVNFNNNEIISPKVLDMMTDADVQSVFKVSSAADILRARDGIVGKLNNFIFDLKDTASLTPNLRTRSSMSGKAKQGTGLSFGVNIAGQYLSSPMAFTQRVLGVDLKPPRGEKWDKLNFIEKGGVMLAISTIAGFVTLNTKEAISNIEREALGLKTYNRYNLFDKDGELDLIVAGKSLAVGGALGMWGDMIVKFADNSDNISGSLGEIPAIGAVAPLLNLMHKLVIGDTKNIDRYVYKVASSITPNIIASKDIVNAAWVAGIDWLFGNHLKRHLERNRRKYAK
jgi:hypothetical protein